MNKLDTMKKNPKPINLRLLLFPVIQTISRFFFSSPSVS